MRNVIEVENLSKMYRLGVLGYGTLKDDLRAAWARFRGREDPNTQIGKESRLGKHGEFWALRGISFEAEQGDRVGIIGKNGAGKSTLLKIMSHITAPTEGRIKLRGRVASLLEVGTGFHPELTGRENVFLNGAILGMKRREIQSKFDEIVDFSGVGDFIDTPVKRYSSGMYVRLAFSVAAHLECDIMIVDEVLAVGDVEFQKKAIGRMEQVSTGLGRTVLFVSHNMIAVGSLCNRGIVLDKGQVACKGDIDTALTYYLAEASQFSESGSEWKGREGDDQVVLTHTWIRPMGADIFETATPVEIGIEVEVLKPVVGLVLGFTLLSAWGDELAYVLYDDAEGSEPPKIAVGKMEERFVIPANTLAHGEYKIRFDVGIHMVKRIINEEGTLGFSIENIKGLGRRFLVAKDVKGKGGILRPAWHAPKGDTISRPSRRG